MKQPPVSDSSDELPLWARKTKRAKTSADLIKTGLRYRQGSRNFFDFVLNGDELTERTEVPYYDEHTKKGYQRLPDEDRVKAAARYVAEGGIFPTNVLTSVRGEDAKKLKIRVLSSHGIYDVVEVRIPVGTTVYLVDGQHRDHALQWAKEKHGTDIDQFGVGVTLMIAQDELDEALVFRTIHKEQKGVKTDLTDRLLLKEIDEGRTTPQRMLDAGEVKKYREWAGVRVTQILDADPKSPWFSRLKPPNAERIQAEAKASGTELPEWTVTEHGMANTLKEFVKAMHPKPPERIAAVVIAYWNAVVEVCPQAWHDEDNYPYLHNSTGCYILNLFLPAAYNYAVDAGVVSTETFAEVLKRAGVDDALFRKGGELYGVGGIGGFKKKVQSLEATLVSAGM